ncbi:hypothetical protein GQR58_009284 [Nymphon striatum]|nr:hypothetical protein GQR58_009284 [Nymphon striatum]
MRQPCEIGKVLNGKCPSLGNLLISAYCRKQRIDFKCLKLIIQHFPLVYFVLLHLSRLGHPSSSEIQLHDLQFKLVKQAHTDMKLLPDNRFLNFQNLFQNRL